MRAAQRVGARKHLHTLAKALFSLSTSTVGRQTDDMIGGISEKQVAFGFEVGGVEAVQHAACHFEMFAQFGQGFLGDATYRLALRAAFGVGAQRRFEFVGDADVIHYQSARLVFEHAVDAQWPASRCGRASVCRDTGCGAAAHRSR